ncbi:MAG: hypothetical protein RLZZ196_1103 [Bacteroidota bacterium]|jgi:hypothetical protein
MKKPYPVKKTSGLIKKSITEYGGAESYPSKSAMMKHEKAEPKKKEMAEGKAYKTKVVNGLPKKVAADSMSSKKSTVKPPKEGFSLGKTMKKATSAIKKAVGGPKKKKSNPFGPKKPSM